MKPSLGCLHQGSEVSGARHSPTLPVKFPSHWGTPAFLTCGYLLLLHFWNAARTLVSLPFPFGKECDYGTCLYSLGVLDFVLVLTGLGTRVKQIHRFPLDRALLPGKASEGVGHCVHMLTAAHLHCGECGCTGLPLGSPVPGPGHPLRGEAAAHTDVPARGYGCLGPVSPVNS